MPFQFTPQHIEKFWGRVGCADADACWLWQGSTDGHGYGQMRFYDRRDGSSPAFLTHRLAFYFTFGRWPTPCGLHRCDTPLCCNPAHIFEGTRAENTADMLGKGRHRTWNRKLTEVQVHHMRRRWEAGEATPSLAQAFGVDRGTVWRIVTRRSWKHV